jgi:hypothetical protein
MRAVIGALAAVGCRRTTNPGIGPGRSAVSEAGGDAASPQPGRPRTIQSPEFTQEVRDRNDRGLGKHMRVTMTIADGRGWHAGCLLTGTSQQR